MIKNAPGKPDSRRLHHPIETCSRRVEGGGENSQPKMERKGNHIYNRTLDRQERGKSSCVVDSSASRNVWGGHASGGGKCNRVGKSRIIKHYKRTPKMGWESPGKKTLGKKSSPTNKTKSKELKAIGGGVLVLSDQRKKGIPQVVVGFYHTTLSSENARQADEEGRGKDPLQRKNERKVQKRGGTGKVKMG